MLAIRRPQRSWRIAIAVVAALALVGACLAIIPFFGDHQHSSQTAPVKLRGADGLGLHTARVNGIVGPNGPVTADSAVYHITPDGHLPRPVTILIGCGSFEVSWLRCENVGFAV